MEKVHDGLPAATFTKPSGVVQVEVCRDSGLLPTELCKKDRRGSRVYTEYFNSKNGTIPTEYCTTHKVVEVCPDSFKLANPTCISKVGTVGIVFIDRNYQTPPSSLPEDYEYEVPKTYCELDMHYCPKDENGNYITYDTNYNSGDDEEDDDTPSYLRWRWRNY